MCNLFRAFSSTKKKGLGLGLAISKSIAQSHGGDLSVDPGGDGSGAIFTLKLPLDRGASGSVTDPDVS
ncbi:MAG: ATP-binding protein [Breoghania sp.]|nr:ATP-binding protein [Breoghania sp.]MDJ0933463.1 ATP-binding protein [Breoghania sp.]